MPRRIAIVGYCAAIGAMVVLAILHVISGWLIPVGTAAAIAIFAHPIGSTDSRRDTTPSRER